MKRTGRAGKARVRNVRESREFGEVFRRLKDTLERHAGDLRVKHDEPELYSVQSGVVVSGKKPLFFGAVKINKSYVSYHLMPVYVFPELLDDISPKLRKCIQGKSCFNFLGVDEQLFGELDKLTKKGLMRFKKAGFA